MYRRQDFILTLVACFTLPAACPVVRAQPLGTAFTYQGQLKDDGSPASGAHHMTFTLHSHATNIAPVGSPIVLTDVPVTEGLFTVELDFGASAINGNERWLQIEINGEPLSPRQRLAAAPYALQARGIHVDSGGKVGIGTMTPQDRLTVRTASDDYGISHTDGTITLCTYVGGSVLGGWLGTRSLHSLHFFTGNSSAQMTLNSTGNVGIGTTIGTHRLTINSPTISALRLIGPFGAFGFGARLNFGDSNLAYIEEDEDDTLQYRASRHAFSAGNVGIGTTSPSQRLHVVGNICATGTIGACSDARYKDHVEPVTGAMEKVEQLRGVNFDWKREEFPDHEFAEARQLGFIAQEVEEVLPQVVSRGEDGYLSVDYGRLTPLLVEAIKELRMDNQRLHTEKDRQLAEKEARIAELTQRLEKIEAILDKLNLADEGAQR